MRAVKRLLQTASVLFAVLILLFWLAHAMGWFGESAVAAWLTRLRDAGDGSRFWVMAGVMVLLALDLFLPIPSSIVMTVNGSLIGFPLAFLSNTAGSLLCAAAGYGLCRWLGRPFFLRFTAAGDVARAERFWDRYGGWSIVLSRALPMFTEIMGCLAGLIRMRFSKFIFFTLIGVVPLSAFYAWAGTRSVEAGGGWAFLAAIAVSALLFAGLETVPHIRRHVTLKGDPHGH